MRAILDTQAFLWWVFSDARLSKKARRVIENAANECLLSLASVWEMAIKAGAGKLKLTQPLAEFIPYELRANGFALLEIRFSHVALLENMAPVHRDPFDRLIAAQALTEQLPVISVDRAFEGYGVERVW